MNSSIRSRVNPIDTSTISKVKSVNTSSKSSKGSSKGSSRGSSRGSSKGSSKDSSKGNTKNDTKELLSTINKLNIPNDIKYVITKDVTCSGLTIMKLNNNKRLCYNKNKIFNNDIDNLIRNLINLFCSIQIYKHYSSWNSGELNYNRLVLIKMSDYYNASQWHLRKEKFKDNFNEKLEDFKRSIDNKLENKGGLFTSLETLDDNIFNYEKNKDYDITTRRSGLENRQALADFINDGDKFLKCIQIYNNTFKKGFLKTLKIYEFIRYDRNKKIKFSYILKHPNGLIIGFNEFINLLKNNKKLNGIYYKDKNNGERFESLYPFSGMTGYKANKTNKKYQYNFNDVLYTNTDFNIIYYGLYIQDSNTKKVFDETDLYLYNDKIINKSK